MKKMQSVLLSLGLVVLATTACRFSPLPDLADGGGGIDGASSDGAINDAASVALKLESLAGGIGGPGSLDGTATAAHFYQPFGVTVDSAVTVYVADLLNHTIRKVTAVGVVTTLAGTADVAGSEDGMGTAARFNFPKGVAVDS